MLHSKRASGFTLLEISIVIAIIALVVGGLTVGKAIIFNASISSTLSQIARYRAAKDEFQAKYNCLPGKCINAQQYGLSINSNSDDTGEGCGGPLIDGLGLGYYCGNAEGVNFWLHLYNSKLINEAYSGYVNQFLNTNSQGLGQLLPGIDFPATKAGAENNAGIFVAFDLNQTPMVNAFWIINSVAYNSSSGALNIYGALTAEANFAIDSKIDDGFPQTGKVKLGPSIDSAQEFYSVPGTAGVNFVADSNPYGALIPNNPAATPFCALTNVTPAAYNIANPGNTQNSRCILEIDF